MKLGRLQEVDIRKVWPHEQFDFSKWLATEENMQLLGDVLGISPVDIETEKFVGSYRCDILCKDEFSGKAVLIENQLEPTNHEHFGKLITYASGLDASVIVWIVSSAREEHVSAIEWLNNSTNNEISFFLIEVHAYRIGDSLPAPYFKVIEQPNNFTKIARSSSKGGAELTESQRFWLDFWCSFNDVLEQRGTPFNKRKPAPCNWYNAAVGSSECHITIELNNKEHRIRVGLWIPDSKELFDSLHEHKADIEHALGYSLNWQRMDGKKASIICTYIGGLDFKNQSNYSSLMNKIVDYVLAMREVFSTYLRSSYGA